MKQISIYTAILLILSLSSCDDFLDIKPVGKVIPSTYQDYRDLMTNAYEIVPTDRSLSTVRGDELQLIYDDWDNYHTPYVGIFTWNDINPDPSTIEFPWQPFYKGILNANQTIIDGVNATDGTQAEIDQVRGEAFLMRAYLHFSLAGLYSDVYSTANVDKKSIPLVTTIDIWKEDKRNTIGEVYSQILSDINDGLKLLNVDKQQVGINYRFSRISAYGFAARVHAYMGNWEKAKEYAKLAYDIDHSLVDLNEPGALLPTVYTSPENILAMEQTFYSELKSRFYVSDKLIDAFDKTEDLRFAKYFEKSGSGSNYKCSLGYKLDNKVSMRTAEFYLLLAASEAQLANGDLTKGKTYLKDLLVKRLTPTYYATEAAAIDAITDKATFIQRVNDERFRELACQGFRWYDLRYFGKPRIEKIFNGETFVLEQGDRRYVIPFPSEATEADPGLLN